jgi:hypothetical protein
MPCVATQIRNTAPGMCGRRWRSTDHSSRGHSNVAMISSATATGCQPSRLTRTPNTVVDATAVRAGGVCDSDVHC